MGTATQPKNRFTQLAGKVIERMVTPEFHFTRLIGGERTVRREQIMWEEREIGEEVAETVERNTSGNDNKFNKWTEKMISGVEFHEKMSINEILVGLVGSGQADYNDSGLRNDFAQEVVRRMEYINNKIVRAKEKAAAQFFQSGVITYKTHPDGFDFKRPATAIVDLGASKYWSVSDFDLEDQVVNDRRYFRQTAKYQGREFDWTMSDIAYINLLKNPFFNQDKKQISFESAKLVEPRFNESGAGYMGTFTIAGCVIHMWVYDGEAKGVQTGGSSLERYMPQNYVVKTPRNLMLGEVTYFPIDSAMAGGSTGLPKVIVTKMHQWDHIEPSSDTLVKHIKTRPQVIPYYNKAVKTDKVLPDA